MVHYFLEDVLGGGVQEVTRDAARSAVLNGLVHQIVASDNWIVDYLGQDVLDFMNALFPPVSEPEPSGPAVIVGVVTSSRTGSLISGVSVAYGNVSASTNASGQYTLEVTQAVDGPVTFTKDGYEDLDLAAPDLVPGQSVSLNAQMVPLSTTPVLISLSGLQLAWLAYWRDNAQITQGQYGNVVQLNEDDELTREQLDTILGVPRAATLLNVSTSPPQPEPENYWLDQLRQWTQAAFPDISTLLPDVVNQIRDLFGLDPLSQNNQVAREEWLSFVPGANALSKLMYGQTLAGEPATGITIGEGVEIALLLIPLPVGRVESIAARIAEREVARGSLIGLERILASESNAIARGASRTGIGKALWGTAIGAFRWLFQGKRGRGVPGVFTITEIPQTISMLGFLTLAAYAIFRGDPRDVGFRLQGAKDTWEGGVYAYINARQASNREGMLQAINTMAAARETYATIMSDVETELRNQGLWESSQIFLEYMDQALQDYQAETESVTPVSEQSSVTFTSSPTQAQIYVDGAYQYERTQTTLLLSPGQYEITYKKIGYQDLVQTINVPSASSISVTGTLLPTEETPLAPATLTITSTPENAQVYIDFAYAFASTPSTVQIDPGLHTLTLKKTGYYDTSIQVNASEGESLSRSLTLEARPEEPGEQPVNDQGTISVLSNVQGARIYVDNAFAFEYTPTSFSVPAGPHVVTLKTQGYQDASQAVNVIANDVTTVDINLTSTDIESPPLGETTGQAFIQVSSTPAQARIYVDNTYTYETTPATITVTPGQRVITTKKSGYYDASQAVEALRDQTSQVSLQLEQVPEGTEQPSTVVDKWKVNVFSTPPGARIIVNGSIVESNGYNVTTPGFVILGAGTYELTVFKTGYEIPTPVQFTLPLS